MNDKLKSLVAGLGTVDPRWFTFLAAIRIFCLVLGSVLAENNLGSGELHHVLTAVAGSVMAVGSAAWGLYASFRGLWKAQAVGVQAGINLTAAGAAVDSTGATIGATMPDGAPPKTVTLASTRQIVHDYGPAPSEIGKS